LYRVKISEPAGSLDGRENKLEIESGKICGRKPRRITYEKCTDGFDLMHVYDLGIYIPGFFRCV
jgi:hypothetical protein